MTGRARKLSAAERSRREFQGYTDTSSVQVSFSLLNICFSGRGVRGEGRASGATVVEGGSADFHFFTWYNGKAMNLIPSGVSKWTSF